MASKIMSIAAFAALAMAVPQHAEHMGKSNVARGISYDGSCGSWSGATCPDSECCSVDGWCGTSTTHCGTGCQAGFGKCAGGASAPLASAAAPVQSPPAQSPPAVQSPPTYGEKSSSSSAAAVVPTTHTTAPTTLPAVPTTTTSPLVGPSEPATTAKSSSSAEAKAPGLFHPTTESASTTAAAIVHSTTSAAAQLTVSSSIAAAKPTGGATTNGNKGTDAYTYYKGDGSSGAGWPTMDKWVGDFETMWNNNLAIIKTACSRTTNPDMYPLWKPDAKTENTDAETATLKQALIDQSKSSGIDARFALAIMMQESKGCVRIHSTDNGVTNPGVFQDHNGKGMCNNADGNAPVTPCPDNMIKQMAQDGIDGTASDANPNGKGGSGDGLKQVIASNGKPDDAQTYYKAARVYNSGSLGGNDLSAANGATACYSSDVANRLTGWTMAASSCK